MELRQLEYFVAVAEEGNFTKAATKVHVAQPGVSAQIRRLERELGEQLLDRSGRTVRLTEVGAAVLRYARSALAAATGAKLVVDEFTGLVRGRVAVGMVASSSTVDLAGLLADFHEKYPAVEIALSEANSDQLVQALQAGHMEVAIIGLASEAPQGLNIQVIADEALVVGVSADDPFAGRTEIAFEEIRERKLICLPPGTGLRACLDEGCAAVDFTPQVAFEASDPRVLVQLAGRGLGIAVLPRSLAMADPRVRVVPISNPALRGSLALAWRPEGAAGPDRKSVV